MGSLPVLVGAAATSAQGTRRPTWARHSKTRRSRGERCETPRRENGDTNGEGTRTSFEAPWKKWRKAKMRPFDRLNDKPREYLEEVLFPSMIQAPFHNNYREKTLFSPSVVRILKKEPLLTSMVWWSAMMGKTGLSRWPLQKVAGYTDRRFKCRMASLWKKRLVNLDWCDATQLPVYNHGFFNLSHYDFDAMVKPFFALFHWKDDKHWPFAGCIFEPEPEPIWQPVRDFKNIGETEAGEMEISYMRQFGSPTRRSMDYCRKFDPGYRNTSILPREWKKLMEFHSWVRDVAVR
jgi:hypothetical protein